MLTELDKVQSTISGLYGGYRIRNAFRIGRKTVLKKIRGYNRYKMQMKKDITRILIRVDHDPYNYLKDRRLKKVRGFFRRHKTLSFFSDLIMFLVIFRKRSNFYDLFDLFDVFKNPKKRVFHLVTTSFFTRKERHLTSRKKIFKTSDTVQPCSRKYVKKSEKVTSFKFKGYTFLSKNFYRLFHTKKNFFKFKFSSFFFNRARLSVKKSSFFTNKWKIGQNFKKYSLSS